MKQPILWNKTGDGMRFTSFTIRTTKAGPISSMRPER
jgi:hypothetical protein